MVFGSVASKVIHASSRPFLLVRARPGEKRRTPVRIQHILLPLDGSELSASILPYVEETAKAVGATLFLFTAVPPLPPYPGAEIAPFPISLIGDLVEGARSSLEQSRKGLESRGVTVRTSVAVGFAVDEIIQAAEGARCDIVAMATHGRSA